MAFTDLSPAVTPAATVVVVIGLAASFLRLLARPPGRTPPDRASSAGRVTASAGGPPIAAAAITRWSATWRRWDERRARAARRQAWPSVADEICSALRSGASLRQALGAAAAHGGAVATRLADLVTPLSRGDDLAGLAQRWADRAVEADERLLAEAVGLAAGATRAEPALFDTVSRTLRERLALAGEVRAQTAQARASAAALSALPFLFTGLCTLADRSILSFLVATLPGGACLVFGVALQGLGLWWMHRTIAGVAP
jgi:tight adherence protein B